MDDVPPRSRLYHLAPLSHGAPLLESLTSYVNRLAWMYRINPRQFIAQEIIPSLGGSYWSYLHRLGMLVNEVAKSINGAGKVALDWSSTLEKLTMRTDLRHLSVHSWANELPSIGLLRKTPAWCPGCYRDWQNNGCPIYQPLLWMLQIVTICLEHRQRLEEQCPHCQKHQAFFASTVLPAGHCTQCRSWLGTISNGAADVEIDDETLAWQKWVTSTIEELRVASTSSGTLPWGNFRFGLSACRQILGGTKQLVPLSDVHEISLTRWITGSVMPSLESILKLCYVLDLSPLQLMTSTSSTLEEAMKAKSASRLPRPKRPAPQPKVQANTLGYLQAILDGREAPHSVRWIERHLGLGLNTLIYHHPKETKLVAALYRAHLAERSRLRKEQIYNEVTTATVMVDAQGLFPSELRVSKMLSNPNWMRSAEGLTAWHAARRKLGLEE